MGEHGVARRGARGRLALAAVTAGAGVGFMAPAASAVSNVLNVDNSNPAACSDTAGSATYCTIPAAMANAQAGDTVNVVKGTYSGPVAVTKAITLDGNGQAVIAGGADGFVVNGVSGVTIDGFAVRNTTGPGFLLGSHSGAHLVTANLTVKDNTVTGSGGGLPGTAGVTAQPGFDS